MNSVASACELCRGDGGSTVWRDAAWRVVRVDEVAFPAFYRVVCNAHVREFTDLGNEERRRCMALVAAVEQVLRTTLQPTKVNLASLGNAVAHLHWHVIARFEWDSHFPQPVWGQPQRSLPPPLPAQRLLQPLTQVDAAVAAALAALAPSGRD